MKFTLIKPYKSLTPPLEIELPDFSIITGENGSGKTHLLHALTTGAAQLHVNGAQIRNDGSMIYVNPHSLVPNDSYEVSRVNLASAIQHAWGSYTNYISVYKRSQYAKIEEIINEPRTAKLVKAIIAKSGKELDQLTENDFHKLYPVEDAMHNNIFHQSFSNAFRRYNDRYRDNLLAQYENEKMKNGKPFLSETEFKKLYGPPPWEIVNSILSEASLEYTCHTPENLERDASFQFFLIHKLTGELVPISELSSGEKVLLALGLTIYNSQNNLEFPKLLLLDEPDASLHPSMCKQFLDVVERVFIQQNNVKVIITTHSPSTVALAKEEAIFLMQKQGVRLLKTTKDTALNVLTSGVPSLSIHYENRRQVFVESKYDVEFYEKVYNKTKSKLISEISLDFISSGVHGRGTCDQVIEVVGKLSGYGNKSIFGIIDWDTKRETTTFIKVLGEKKRYSIENYICDPLLLAACLLREKKISWQDLGLPHEINYPDFKHLSAEHLQLVSDYITTEVAKLIKPKDLVTKQPAKYLSGIEIQIPKWYLTHKGHDLEEALPNVFPYLQKFKNQGELKRELIEKIIDDIPELISQDILDVFLSIQHQK